ncbi:MAG: flagellar export protein FliJ [candidate division Zixibacteria bacterium]|nr:flagellar export protein FliJ [candidate division Zixibacteria bacterium]
MKKFHYRLQRILSVKRTLKKQAQKALAKSQNERNSQKRTLENLERELVERLTAEKTSRRDKLDLHHLNLYHGYISQLKFMILNQRQLLANAEKDVEEKREKLVEASREEKKYARLKEIRKEEYTRELELALQKETDEFAKNVHRLNK